MNEPSLCTVYSVSACVSCYLLVEKCSVFNNWLMLNQLVQFLLKQAGVDKRTGDLFGNRDLLNIARNMARGLKVCSGKL